jgi:hypothetical protein
MDQTSRAIVLANTIIWVAVLFASLVVLQGSAELATMVLVLGSGAVGSTIVVGGGIRHLAVDTE